LALAVQQAHQALILFLVQLHHLVAVMAVMTQPLAETADRAVEALETEPE
jgi:hypothetical protein